MFKLASRKLSYRECKEKPLCPLTPNSPGQLHIFGHDCNSLGMNGAQVGILKETDKIRFCGLLQSQHSRALEPQVCLEVLGNFANKPLKGQLPDQQFGGLLVFSNLSECYSSRPANQNKSLCVGNSVHNLKLSVRAHKAQGGTVLDLETRIDTGYRNRRRTKKTYNCSVRPSLTKGCSDKDHS